MSNNATLDSDLDVLEQVVDPSAADLTSEAAVGLLGLRFNADAIARINDLAEKNRLGTLSLAERHLLERYQRVGNFLNLVHAKARLSLARPDSKAS